MVPENRTSGAACVRTVSNGHRLKANNQALTRARAWRRSWRLRRRCRRSNLRWRASSARMSEVRGERTGTAV
jgi:hypothetical protein